MEKCVVVTGAAGFAGANLTEHLLAKGYDVFAQVRPGSSHNVRLENNDAENLHIISLDIGELDRLPYEIFERFPELEDDGEKFQCFYHLLWGGGRDAFEEQRINIDGTLHALGAAQKLRCARFIGTGSQAEYGATEKVQAEDEMPEPFSSYGAAKTAAMYLSRNLAAQYQIEWIWARIFSLIGKYEPSGRMLPDLIKKAAKDEKMDLSSCRQNWDFLDAGDCAEGFISLGEKGVPGEIYNLTGGDIHPLKYYIDKANDWSFQRTGHRADVHFGADPAPFVSLQPDAAKIRRDTGWVPEVTFEESLENYSG